MDTRTTISQAFTNTPRINFIPNGIKHLADIDEALPIGYGQTISQPSTVYDMLTWLRVKPGNNVLDVGYGSGWTSALLSHLVGKNGSVDATEIIPELATFGKQNCVTLGINNVHFHSAGKKIGYPPHAPYDRILVSASAQELPQELINQLKIGGIMVIPVGDTILEITKKSSGIDIVKHWGYAFVPLV